MARRGPEPGKFVTPLATRFWAKVQKSDGCWTWTAARLSGNRWAYGVIGLPGSRRLGLAHRVSWELANGPIPVGMWVLHRCDNTTCVRPDHLFLGTHDDNMRDMARKGRQANQNTYKDSCQYGHPFTMENTRVYRGTRNCRTCARERMRLRRRAA